MSKVNKLLAAISVVSTATLGLIAYNKYKEDKLLKELMKDDTDPDEDDMDYDTGGDYEDESLEPVIGNDTEEEANSYCECGYGGKCFGRDFSGNVCTKHPEGIAEDDTDTEVSEDASDEVSEDSIEWADESEIENTESIGIPDETTEELSELTNETSSETDTVSIEEDTPDNTEETKK